MSLQPGVRDAQAFLTAMDPESIKLKKNDPEAYRKGVELAGELLSKAWGMYEAKGKFMAVGQLYLRDGSRIKTWDAKADKVCLGPFPTEKQARDACFTLAYSNMKAVQGDELLTMVIPYFHGTPAQFHKQRAEEIESDRPKGSTQAERLSALTEEQCEPCPLETIDEELEFVPCVRDSGHPGDCFAQFPESWGLEVVDGIKRVREQYEERG